MGNRVKGKVKRKSVKAALGSDAGSKRKLSRMGKKQKKEHGELEATFIGRSKCLKMLQITLKDFRRLCILKGIYPRDPVGRFPGKKKGQSFYHIKDIKAIAHEPVLEKFREFRAYMKKIRRAAGRNERDEAIRKNALVPTYTIHHLVKERYPRFVDALADLDDALTLTYLFAALPADKGIKTSVINKAKSLAAAWGAYCATTSSITKSFISVKGVYIEASIQNTEIRWVIPHAFTQFLPEDVDYRVMMTFFEFYETLLKFVLFKLYNDIGVRYPFTTKDMGGEAVGSTAAILGRNLKALRSAMDSSEGAIGTIVSESLQKQGEEAVKPSSTSTKNVAKSVNEALQKVTEETEGQEDEEDEVDVAGPLQAALDSMAEDQARTAVPGGTEELDDDALKRRRMLAGLTFYLSREVPRGYLELICLAFGGKVGWEGEGSPVAMKDASITHHIVDRPRLPTSYDDLPKSREFIQPQWLLDSTNFMFLLPIAKYSVGADLPPHLSPWVDDEEEGYKPAYADEIERLKNGLPIDEVPEAIDEMVAEPASDDDDEEIEDEEPEDEGDDVEEEETIPTKKKSKKRKSAEEEEHELAKSMMTKKAAHLYGRMQHGLAKKQAKIDTLRQRRKEVEAATKLQKGRQEIEETKEKKEGKTFQKQKVERLRKERKDVVDTYSNTGGTMKKSKRNKRS